MLFRALLAYRAQILRPSNAISEGREFSLLGFFHPNKSQLCSLITCALTLPNTLAAQTILERVLLAFPSSAYSIFANESSSAALTGSLIDGSILNQIGSSPLIRGSETLTSAFFSHSPWQRVEFQDIDALGIASVNTGAIDLDASKLAGVIRGENVQQSTAYTLDSFAQTRISGSDFNAAEIMYNAASNANAVLGRVDNKISGLSAEIASITATAIGSVNSGIIRDIHSQAE